MTPTLFFFEEVEPRHSKLPPQVPACSYKSIPHSLSRVGLCLARRAQVSEGRRGRVADKQATPGVPPKAVVEPVDADAPSPAAPVESRDRDALVRALHEGEVGPAVGTQTDLLAFLLALHHLFDGREREEKLALLECRSKEGKSGSRTHSQRCCRNLAEGHIFLELVDLRRARLLLPLMPRKPLVDVAVAVIPPVTVGHAVAGVLGADFAEHRLLEQDEEWLLLDGQD